MMDSHTVMLPDYTLGADAYKGVETVVRPFGKRVLVLGGERALHAGLQKLTCDAPDIEWIVLPPFKENATLEVARRIAKIAVDSGVHALAGMGGGRVLDTAKAAAHLCDLPCIVFPTIAATCAAVTALSVLYREDGSFDRFLRLKPPVHAFIHTGILSAAPVEYLRAGIGDSIAKYVECTFAARGDKLNHANMQGVLCASACWQPLLDDGAQAVKDCAAQKDTEPFRKAALCCIISTGLVSLLVNEEYNGALAHSLYYALEELPAVANGSLHGDVVAWGSLVQLVMDGKTEDALRLAQFLDSIGTRRRLCDMGVDVHHEETHACLRNALNQPDMSHIPYPVTAEMVQRAVEEVERWDVPATGKEGV